MTLAGDELCDTQGYETEMIWRNRPLNIRTHEELSAQVRDSEGGFRLLFFRPFDEYLGPIQ